MRYTYLQVQEYDMPSTKMTRLLFSVGMLLSLSSAATVRAAENFLLKRCNTIKRVEAIRLNAEKLPRPLSLQRHVATSLCAFNTFRFVGAPTAATLDAHFSLIETLLSDRVMPHLSQRMQMGTKLP